MASTIIWHLRAKRSREAKLKLKLDQQADLEQVAVSPVAMVCDEEEAQQLHYYRKHKRDEEILKKKHEERQRKRLEEQQNVTDESQSLQ
ncbi:hypothetical protein HDV05_008491, partial [Chytridiales sp. JEL 0842]